VTSGGAGHRPLARVPGDIRRALPSTVLAHQVHGTDVHWHESVPAAGHPRRQRWPRTREDAVLLTVTVADCIPVYLAVPRKGAVALVHAGWRGTADGILEQCIELLKWRGFAKASDIVMHCGVGICGVVMK